MSKLLNEYVRIPIDGDFLALGTGNEDEWLPNEHVMPASIYIRPAVMLEGFVCPYAGVKSRICTVARRLSTKFANAFLRSHYRIS